MVALVADTAMTPVPRRSRSVTSTTTGRRQFSARLSVSVCATWTPFTCTVQPSSAVMTRRARVRPAGMPDTSRTRRNQRVAAGALLAGSPSGNQIHEAPSRAGAPTSAAGAAIQRADQSAAVSPVSHQDGALQSVGLPSASQTRTDQW